MTYNKDTYCSLAFSGFDTRTKSVCCWAKFNTKFNSYSEAMRSPEVIALQTDLVNGVQNPICCDCWSQENAGVKSMRRGELSDWSPEKKLRRLVIDSGNVCNLSCRTCGPDSSSSHIKEFEAKHNKKYNIKIKKTDIEYLKKEDYSHIEIISVLGGEPFQNLDHLEILELIVERGYAKNCSLSYITNGTIPLSDKIKNLFTEFKNVGIVVSIDAIDKQFEYIRTNGVWSSLENNITNLAEELKSISGHLHGHPTISALNILYLEELFQWYTDRNISYDTIFCTWPTYYSFTIFNDLQKAIIIKQLEQSKFNTSGIIQQLKDSVFDADSLTKFYSEIKFTKEYKNLDIYEYLPKLMELLEG